jgi:hypothetical protein
MQLLVHVIFELLLLRRSDNSLVSEGSTKGMQAAALAMLGIASILLLFAILVTYHT